MVSRNPDSSVSLAVAGEAAFGASVTDRPSQNLGRIGLLLLAAAALTGSAAARFSGVAGSAGDPPGRSEMPWLVGAALVFGLCFSLWVASQIARRSAQAREAATWPVRRAAVEHSAVEETFSIFAGSRYRPAIRYRYEVEGVAYPGERLRIDAGSHANRGAAESDIAPYAPGDAIDVRVDPGVPARSVILPEAAYGDLYFELAMGAAVSLAAIVGLAILLL